MLFEFLESRRPDAVRPQADRRPACAPINRPCAQAAHVLARKFGAKARSAGRATSGPSCSLRRPSSTTPSSCFRPWPASKASRARRRGKSCWPTPIRSSAPRRCAGGAISRATRKWSKLLVRHAPELLKTDESLTDDLVSVLRHLDKADLVKDLNLPDQEKDKDVLTKFALADWPKMPAAETQKRAALGLQVFERNACTKCHTTATQTTLLAPSLKGIAAARRSNT